jgi:hypothetical protein
MQPPSRAPNTSTAATAAPRLRAPAVIVLAVIVPAVIVPASATVVALSRSRAHDW